jgi:hypothetical protein
MIGRIDEGPVLGSGAIHMSATLILIVGIVLTIGWWKNPESRNIGLIGVAVGLIPLLINGYRYWKLRQALGRADLELEDPVPLGFSGTAGYYRTMQGVELRSIEARLQCEEEIVRGGGKNKTRVTKIVHDEVLTPAVTPMMEGIGVRLPIRIPATGPATFSCSTAETKWWIRLRLKMSGCPNTASSFEIQVAPGLEHL